VGELKNCCCMWLLLLLYTPDEDKTIKHRRDSFVVREKQREFKWVD
jgi:hypothetical protein